METMETKENGLLAEAVTAYLAKEEAGAAQLKIDTLWDGDTYSYSLVRGEEVLSRSYDGTDVKKSLDMLEEGRKLCASGDPGRYGRIREFAERQFFAETGDGRERAGFEYRGQFITDPWMDESGRFELDDGKALSHYGSGNVALFVILVSDRIALFESFRA